jgi:hypothetical protein
MPKQPNYVQLIPTTPQSVSISRLAESENDADILEYRLPAEFGFDPDDNLELHFYDSQNNLVNTTIVGLSTGVISIRSLSLPDGTREEKLVVDMTRAQTDLGLFLSPGTYTLVINLFSDEIGTYANKKLSIDEISESRTELRLGFNVPFTSTEQQELFEFIEPGLPRVLAGGAMSAIMGLNEGDVVSNQQFEPVQTEEFIVSVNDALNELVPDLQTQLVDIEQELPDELNQTIEIASAAVYDEFVQLLVATKNSNIFDRLQASELDILVERAVDNAFINNNIGLLVQGKIQLI